MNRLQEEEYFLEISDSFENKAEIYSIGNQSLQIKLPCGCIQTQNFFCGQPSRKRELNPYYDLQQAVRFQWFEFCIKHIKR